MSTIQRFAAASSKNARDSAGMQETTSIIRPVSCIHLKLGPRPKFTTLALTGLDESIYLLSDTTLVCPHRIKRSKLA